MRVGVSYRDSDVLRERPARSRTHSHYMPLRIRDPFVKGMVVMTDNVLFYACEADTLHCVHVVHQITPRKELNIGHLKALLEQAQREHSAKNLHSTMRFYYFKGEAIQSSERSPSHCCDAFWHHKSTLCTHWCARNQ